MLWWGAGSRNVNDGFSSQHVEFKVAARCFKEPSHKRWNIPVVKPWGGSEILLHLQANRVACYGLTNAGRKQETAASETMTDSITTATVSRLMLVPQAPSHRAP